MFGSRKLILWNKNIDTITYKEWQQTDTPLWVFPLAKYRDWSCISKDINKLWMKR